MIKIKIETKNIISNVISLPFNKKFFTNNTSLLASIQGDINSNPKGFIIFWAPIYYRTRCISLRLYLDGTTPKLVCIEVIYLSIENIV